MPSKKVLLIITGLSVLVLTGLLFVYNQQSKTPAPTPVQTIPTPTSISKPAAPVNIITTLGIITSVNSSSLTLDISGKSQAFSISGTKDFQKVISGTVEAGDAKTIPSSINELKVGQKVLIIHSIGSNLAKTVYIIK